MALRSPFRRAGSLTFAKQVAKLSRGIVSMPFGARPHLMVTATGRHRPGTTSDLTEVVFEHGLSIAGTKKVMLEERFTIMLALWVPPGGASPAQVCRTLESDEVGNHGIARSAGASVSAAAVPPRSPRRSASSATSQ